MREEGLEHVYQLKAASSNTLNTPDGAHYHGGCFVFDEAHRAGARSFCTAICQGWRDDASASS